MSKAMYTCVCGGGGAGKEREIEADNLPQCPLTFHSWSLLTHDVLAVWGLFSVPWTQQIPPHSRTIYTTLHSAINLLVALALKFAFQSIPVTWHPILFFLHFFFFSPLFLMIVRAFIDFRIYLKAFRFTVESIKHFLFSSDTVKPAKRWQTN